MAIKINTYACDFRCGFVRVKKNTVESHEANCSSNPAKKGCKTCKHFGEFLDSNGMEGSYRQEWLEAVCDTRSLDDPTETNPSGMRFNCSEWEG